MHDCTNATGALSTVKKNKGNIFFRASRGDSAASQPRIRLTNLFCTATPLPRHPYEGCTYCFIHEEAHTNVRFLSCDGHQLYERGVDLEVEGVRYIEMHRGPAAYVLGPPPSRSSDLELEGGVIACHVDYVYEPQDSHVRGTE